MIELLRLAAFYQANFTEQVPGTQATVYTKRLAYVQFEQKLRGTGILWTDGALYWYVVWAQVIAQLVRIFACREFRGAKRGLEKGKVTNAKHHSNESWSSLIV